MQLTNSDALSRTALRDSLAPTGASGSTTPAESFRVVLEEPPTACPSPDGQVQAEEVAADQSAAKSSANEDTESKDDSPASEDKQSMALSAAIVMPAVVEKEFPQAAQVAEGTEEVAPSDAAAADGPAVHAISVAGANTDQLRAAALTKSAPSPPEEQPRGLAGGQAARTFRNSATTQVSALGENPESVVTYGTIGDELPEGNERGEEIRESTASAQHLLEFPTGAAEGLESLHTEIENKNAVEATTPIAQSGESGLPQNSAASAPHWPASRLPPELLAVASGRPMPESQSIRSRFRPADPARGSGL